MKNLLIMRHAKSDYPPDVAEDFDRPLNRRGRRDLPRMASLLTSYESVPDRIVSSAALRARETASGVGDSLGLPPSHLAFEESLYLAAPEDLFLCVSRIDNEVGALMVIAHNPGLEEWISRLCGASVRLPTAAIAALAIEADKWSEIGEDCGWLQWLVVPRLLKALGH
jgi:phosphohistidine phosphatase